MGETLAGCSIFPPRSLLALDQGASTVGSGGRGEFRVLEEVLIDLLNRCGVLFESDAVVGRTRSTEGTAATGA